MQLLTLLLAAVSGAGLPAAAPDSCMPLQQPKRMPAVDFVLDSSAFLGRIRALDTTGIGDVIVGVLMSSPPSGNVVERSAAGAASEAALSHVLATLREAAKGAPQAFRVHLHLGASPTVALERSVLCGPRSLRNEGETVRIEYGRVELGQAGMAPRRPRSIIPSYRVSATGVVEEVNLGSGSGIPDVDRTIRDHMLAERYHPALLDGRPVAVWVSGTKVELIP